MEYTYIIILLALFQYTYFSIRVGAGRPKYKVEAPKTEGNEVWERLFRVQQNTLEQLIIFVPAAMIFGIYIKGAWILIPGLLFLLGRQLYAMEYVNKPSSRALGFGLTFLGNVILLIGGLVALVLRLV